MSAVASAERVRRRRVWSASRGFSSSRLLVDIALLAIGLVLLVPMCWIVLSSFDADPGWALRFPSWTVANYELVLQGGGLGLAPFANSLYLAGVCTLATTLVAVLASFALSRREVPFKRTLVLGTLLLSALPGSMIIVPLYQMYVVLGWTDSLFFTGLALAGFALPLAVWMITRFMNSVPVELDHAAAMEGAGTFTVLFRVVLPLSLPGVTASAILTFVHAWSAFLIPLVLNTNPDSQVASITIYDYLSERIGFQFGAVTAFSILYALPVILLYLITLRQFSGAFSFGGGLRG
jgi:multiple sugar transport system permease protein